MKKQTLITSWALTLALISSVSVANAETKIDTQTRSFVQTKPIQALETAKVDAGTVRFHVQADQEVGTLAIANETQEIEGTVEAIDEFSLKVKTENGTLYTIPITAFKDLDDFQKLDLQVGSKISAKKADMFKSVMVSMSEKPLAIDATTVDTEFVIEENAEKLPLNVQYKFFNANTAEGSLNAAEDVFQVRVIETGEIGEEMTERIFNFDNSEIMRLFFAKEIQANGYTVTLPQ